MTENQVRSACLFETITGSRLYGTSTKSSDFDYRGIFVAPPEYYLGTHTIEQKDKGWDDGADRCIYELKKFFRLAKDANPSILELLFVDPNSPLVTHYDSLWLEILRYRSAFLSKRIAATHLGYATSEWRKVLNATLGSTGKRKEAMEKYGHDPKAASHVVRLLDQGVQLLEHGKITFPSEVAPMLRKIRTGKKSIRTIRVLVSDLQHRLEDALTKTALPEQADMETIEALQIWTIASAWNIFHDCEINRVGRSVIQVTGES